SATTDGLLIGVPASKGYSILGKYYEMDGKWAKFKKEYETQLPQVLNNFGCGDLIEKINTYFPVKRMQYSREKMTKNPDVFEIKHMADEIISVKTRGQIGLLSNGQASLLARFNLKPPLSEIIENKEDYKRMMEESGIERNTEEAKWILKYLSKIENGENKIEHYSFITLYTFQDIFKSDGEKDLVRKVSQRQMNMDWDWKRKIIWADESDKTAITPFTEPFENLSQMLKHRKMMESLRYKNVEGERVPWTVARPETVLEKIAVPRGSVHSRNGDPVVITRQFLRGMMQNKIPLNRRKDSYKMMAIQLNHLWEDKGLNKSFPRVWKEHDFQNAKNPDQAKWQPGLIQSNILLEELVEALVENYGAEVRSTKEILFNFEKFKSDQILLIGEVISAVIDGPKSHVEPFKTLFDSYLLPSKEKIRDTFREQLSEKQLEAFLKKPFVSGGRPSYDQPELKKIFYSLGIPSSKAEKCARSIAPSSRKKGSFRNPGQKRCTEHFLLAVINIVEADSGNHIKYLQQKLQKFGLSRNRNYQIRKSGRFTPNGIANTSKNVSQIKKMANSVDMEPSLFIKALLEK
ncbi:hypothetical protein KAJ27_25760, partial [bacterium]|nr:hypothetical protein [bacterium]